MTARSPSHHPSPAAPRRRASAASSRGTAASGDPRPAPGRGLLARRYRLGPIVGEGGMAVVHRGHDTLLDRAVAIKILRPQYAADPGFVERFQREARAAAAIDHPNVVAVHDAGSDRGREFMVLELVEGRDLEAVLAARPRITLAEAVRIATEAAAALGAAHRMGLVHRDVKPGNILVGDEGQVKVTDFGIARALSEASLTLTGMTLGSVHYVSPEQAVGRDVGPESDVYSLGIVVYELMTGRRPFEADTPMGIVLARLGDEPAPPDELDPTLPAPLVAVVMRALARDPGARFPEGDAFAEALSDIDLRPPVPLEVGVTLGSGRRRGAVLGMPAMRPRTDGPIRLHRVGDRAAAGSGAPARRMVALGLLLLLGLPMAAAAAVLDRSPDDRGATGGSPGGPATAVAAAEGTPRAAASPTSTASNPPESTPARTSRPTPRPTVAPMPAPIASPSPVRGPAATLAPTPVPTAPPVSPQPVAVAPPATTPPTTPLPATPPPATPPPATPSPAPVAGPAVGPAATVARWYGAVSAHDFATAAAMWTPQMRERYPPSVYIDDRFADTTRIEVASATTIAYDPAGSATVAVDLIETLDSGVRRRWVGDWDLVVVGGAWLLEDPDF